MTPKKETIKEFFQGEKQCFIPVYHIPVYQRAYSWEEKQWKCFLDDLREATKGDNHYFFGNVLLEKSGNGSKVDIIDGQQRITTIVIFARALYNVLKDKAASEKLNPEMENDKFLSYIEEDYLICRSKPKLEAVEYDRDYFKNVVIDNKGTHDPQTPSQGRIKKAKEFFTKELKNLSISDLLDIFKVMQNAEILSIYFENKKDSILMFELQNNRGKELTNMEKLKSYLAYQIYTYCSREKSELKLNEITKIFEEIYRLINDIKIGEDSVLNYFNMSRSGFAFSYREDDDSRNYKRELKEERDENKISWIENYMKELKEAFVDFKDFNNHPNIYKDYLLALDAWEIYPFILKAYRLFRGDKSQLEQVFQALEIIAFRHKLVRTRADLASRLSKVLKNFTSIENLKNDLKEICTEEEWYWSDDNINNVLIDMYTTHKDNPKIISYVLMRYEDDLRKEEPDAKGYRSFTPESIREAQIEHIAPQTEKYERLKTGYCKYDKDFLDEYLHCIGNLLLIAKSHNCSLGNKPFGEKLKSYENSPLLQHREIKSFVSEGNNWDKDAIDERHEKIHKFVLQTWSF